MSPDEVFATAYALRNAGWLRAVRGLSDAAFERLVQLQEAEDALNEELSAIWRADWVPPDADTKADGSAAPDDSWVDQFIEGSARRAAIREGLIEPTPFDSSGPFHMNLDQCGGGGDVVPLGQRDEVSDGEE